MNGNQARMTERQAQRNTLLTNKDQKVTQPAQDGPMPYNADALHDIPHDMASSIVIKIIQPLLAAKHTCSARRQPHSLVSHHAIADNLVLVGPESIPLRLAFCHVCLICVHKLRGPHHYMPLASREKYLRVNFRDILGRSKSLRNSYAELW